MATHALPPPSSAGYSFVSYPSDYMFAHANYPTAPPHTMASVPSMPAMELPGIPQSSSPPGYPPHYSPYAHLGHISQGGPPSPMMAYAHAYAGGPPSPIIHNQAPPPSSPDRCSADTKVMRQILTAMTKMQSTMKDMAERQEQILDRMSLLEQRVGRMDDGIGQLLEQSESMVEDSKTIRARVDDNESQDAFENRLTILMDGVVQKLMSGIGAEIKDIKRLVKDTDKFSKFNPFNEYGRMVMGGQRYRDAIILGEEEQKEVDV